MTRPPGRRLARASTRAARRGHRRRPFGPAAACCAALAAIGCAGGAYPSPGGGSSAEGARARNVDSASRLIAAMHDAYADTWYSTLFFKQTVKRSPPEGPKPPDEVWTEYAAVPGNLRIDLADGYNGNGVIYRGDSLYVFRDGAQAQARAQRNELLVLGFDVYGQAPARTLEILEGLGYDLTRFRLDTYEGRQAFVVGADANDLHSPQFWIDAERMLFLRSMRPAGQDTTKTVEIVFTDYEPLAGGWIAPTVIFSVDGREFMREEYFDIRADPDLAEAVFLPEEWGPVE